MSAVRVARRRRPRARRSPRRGARSTRAALPAAPAHRRRRAPRSRRSSTAAWTIRSGPPPPPSDAFVQHFPDEGAPPSERTTVRVLYDDKNLYVGVDCEQLQRADRAAARAARLADPVRRRLDRHRQPAHRRRRVPLRGQRRGHAVGRHPLRRHELLQRLGRGLGGQGRRHRPRLLGRVPHPAVGAALLGAARAGLGLPGAALHRRAPGDRRLGVLPAQRRDATSRCSAASTTCATCRRATPSSCGRSCSGGSATAPPTPTPRSTHGWSADGVGRPRRQGARHQRADAGPGREPRLRPGRGRHRRPQRARCRLPVNGAGFAENRR